MPAPQVDLRVYALVDPERAGGHGLPELAWHVAAGGATLVQLRDKHGSTRTMVEEARAIRENLAAMRVPFLINDRVDVALAADADGVHVGQEELSVRDVRQIVNPELLVGVSTHSVEQARQAVLDGASYLGCGPTFPSETKQFSQFPGLDNLRAVAAEISLPAFAIGGITLENLPEVLATGFTRVAVSNAIALASEPQSSIHQWLAALDATV